MGNRTSFTSETGRAAGKKQALPEVQAKKQIIDNLEHEQGEHIRKRVSEIQMELAYIKEALSVYDSEEIDAL